MYKLEAQASEWLAASYGVKAAATALPALEAERRTLDEQIATADRTLEAAESQHDETTRPLYFRRRQVDQAISEGNASSAAE